MKKLHTVCTAAAVGATVAVVGVLTVTPVAAATWECTAKNLKNYRYTGGARAMIHLSPYNSGGNYRVTKVSDTKVTGKTKDGTSFTCVVK
ncbi:MAG: hypothetical protein GY789_26375 [Hyphomicrobiales bacterium]|nr:hypothetical protein [Hyphomicrobiales bacterium]MCP4999647.1 hypothetical protein [Hyphomicrobiales bacterium]